MISVLATGIVAVIAAAGGALASVLLKKSSTRRPLFADEQRIEMGNGEIATVRFAPDFPGLGLPLDCCGEPIHRCRCSAGYDIQDEGGVLDSGLITDSRLARY